MLPIKSTFFPLFKKRTGGGGQNTVICAYVIYERSLGTELKENVRKRWKNRKYSIPLVNTLVVALYVVNNMSLPI